jgi:hypothetical protein
MGSIVVSECVSNNTLSPQQEHEREGKNARPPHMRELVVQDQPALQVQVYKRMFSIKITKIAA